MSGELLSAVGRVRQAWPMLTDLLEPSRRRPRPRSTTHELMSYLDRVAIADREARRLALRDHMAPTGPVPDAVHAALLDARAAVDTEVVAAANELHRAITNNPIRARAATIGDRVDLALDVLSVAARHRRAPGVLLAMTATRVAHAADVAYRTVGLTAYRVRVAAMTCPACRMRSIWVEQCSPLVDEWVAVCDYSRCRCSGPACRCGRITRLGAARHVWARDEWPTLTAINEGQP